MKPTANGTTFDDKTFYKECTCGSPIDENLECHEKKIPARGQSCYLSCKILCNFELKPK